MYYQYALFSPLVNKKLGKPDSVRRFIPALFFCGLTVGVALSFISKIFLWLLLAVVGAYLLAGVGIGIYQGKKWKKPALAFCLPVTFFLMHFAYASGYIVGKYKVIAGAAFNATANR